MTLSFNIFLVVNKSPPSLSSVWAVNTYIGAVVIKGLFSAMTLAKVHDCVSSIEGSTIKSHIAIIL